MWRRLHNKELHRLYRQPNIVRMIKSRRLRWAGHVARLEGRSDFKILTGKPTRKRSLGRPRRRWGNYIRINLNEIGINTNNWVDSARYRGYCINLQDKASPIVEQLIYFHDHALIIIVIILL
jgi:Cytochrome C oxidase subunit II, transmembrane domain.